MTAVTAVTVISRPGLRAPDPPSRAHVRRRNPAWRHPRKSGVSLIVSGLPVPPDDTWRAPGEQPEQPPEQRYEYEDWLRDAAALVVQEARAADALPDGYWGVSIRPHCDYTRDIDGLGRPTVDVLVRTGIIDDQRYVEYIDCERQQDYHGGGYRDPEGHMTVSVYSLSGDHQRRWERGPLTPRAPVAESEA